jgi:cation-transporting P-type ATPase 13A2
MGLVIKTGFMTTKGGLIRDILYPRPNRFSFYRDSLLYMCVFALFAVIGFACSIKPMLDFEFEPGDIVLRSLDLVTITVPPTLPAVMSIGTGFAIWRLKKLGIFCISPPRINVSGLIKIVVLDKTGTLTEDGLQVYGFRSVIKDQKTGKQHFSPF